MIDINFVDSLSTPITRISCDNNELYVKREDLLPFSFGGNKVRIALEFINDMYEKGLNCIVGYGNARSNLSRALANICYNLAIPCYIISPADEDGCRVNTFNSKIVDLCNAHFIYCTKNDVKETVEKTINDLILQGLKPYYIYGNSNGKGNEHIPLRAYSKIYQEIMGKFDYIFLATGTGMTQGGLLVGQALYHGKENIIGISIARTSENETKILKEMISSYSKKEKEVYVDKIIIDDSYLCDGYGKYNEAIELTIKQEIRENGIPLDPTYTGKAFYGMLDYIDKNNIKNKKILFIHTGGTPLFFDYERNL